MLTEVVLLMVQQVALHAEVNTLTAILQAPIIVKPVMPIVMNALVPCKRIAVHAKMKNTNRDEIPMMGVSSTVSHNLHV